jgi:hypothetical protein
MILVKSLIAILLLIIVFAIYNNWDYFASKFDGREGFEQQQGQWQAEQGQAEQQGQWQAEQGHEEHEGLWQAEADQAEKERAVEEIAYTLPSAVENYELHAGDAKFISELQEKMTELFQLSEKATNINKNIKL